jgi:hypothetical protein
MYVIILVLPKDETGKTINFYEGKVKAGLAKLDSWDSDIIYARIFKKKFQAQIQASNLKLSPAQNKCKVRSLDKYIPKEEQDNFLKYFHKSLLV